jgi:hypothetical protein
MYDSGTAPSYKSCGCNFAQGPVVRKKYAIDDVMKISYLSLLGVHNDPKLEHTPIRNERP